MKLNEVLYDNNSIILIRDGEFESLGLITVKTNSKTITFLEDKKYINFLNENITTVFTTEELFEFIPQNIGVATCENPRIEFFKLHNYLFFNNEHYGRSKQDTLIGHGCRISNSSIISDYNVTIGNNVVLEENTIIRENVRIGNNTIIRAGSIVGGEGFDCKRIGKESIMMVAHAGGVLIGENVEIQYNCCIDKAVFPWDNTVIGDYTKTDNLVHIGHAAKIGKRCLFPANTTISGSTIIGDDCWIGVGATISNNLVIGNDSRVSIGAVVTRNIESGNVVSGNFAIEHKKFIEFIKNIR